MFPENRTTSSVKESYDRWHGSRSIQTKASNGPRDPWYESALPHIQQRARGPFLEIGCGRGEFAVWLARTMPALDITAVDFSTTAINEAGQHAVNSGANVKFVEEDAQSLSFSDNSFQYVLSCECLEHVPRPQQMAFEIFRVLKPGGYFCLTTENYLNGMMLSWMHSWVTGQPFNSGSGIQPHENFFLFWQVRRLLHLAGLVIDQTESSHLQWLLLPRVNPAHLCTNHFSNRLVRVLAKPFGRHFTFFGHKPR
jgi:ubiquinone/menaquinone biosynthesis C-methylase UbiE